MKGRQPQVFISAARKDEALARELARALENLGVRAWWDERIPVGDNWARAVATALDAADALVFLISPEWSGSRYSAHEVEFALSGTRFAERVFPIVVRP